MSKSVDDVTPDMDMFELGPIPDEVAKAQQCVMGVPFGGADGKNHYALLGLQIGRAHV